MIQQVPFYFENEYKIFKLTGKIHKRIVLYRHNYMKHIKTHHPEVSMQLIINILKNPDYVYKLSNNNPDYYYEKKVKDKTFRVVVSRYREHVKEVVTAYPIYDGTNFDRKHVHCVYDKEVSKEMRQQKNKHDDLEFFMNLFNCKDDNENEESA